MGLMSSVAAPGRHTIAVSTGREPGRMGALYMARRKLGLDNRPEAPEAAQVSIMTAVKDQGGAR